MAFDPRGLSMIATNLGGSTPGHVNSRWWYRTGDVIADVNTAGYFNAAAPLLRLHDVIEVLSGIGGTPAIHLVYVNSHNGTVVDVTDGLAITATDTD